MQLLYEILIWAIPTLLAITMHEAALFSYLPVLLLCAAFFGTLTGILTNGILTRLDRLR